MLPKSQARCSITPTVQGRFSHKMVLPENQPNYCQSIAFGNVVALNARSQENLTKGSVVIESYEELGILNSWQLELAYSPSLSLSLSPPLSKRYTVEECWGSIIRLSLKNVFKHMRDMREICLELPGKFTIIPKPDPYQTISHLGWGWPSLLGCTNHVRILLAAIKHGWPWKQVSHDHIIYYILL